ncbi:MAG: L,D-transpeptidase family protein [Parvibaculum sp.]
MIIVRAKSAETIGTLSFRGKDYPCALGRAGIVSSTVKREGDGATPEGTWPLRKLHFRADRIAEPRSGLPQRKIEPKDGWCDAPDDPAYNCPVSLPYPASTETLTRDDALYNIIIELGYNDAPPLAGKGSAIFFHVAKEKGTKLLPTEGCVALRQADLLEVVEHLNNDTLMRIEKVSA